MIAQPEISTTVFWMNIVSNEAEAASVQNFMQLTIAKSLRDVANW
jgi:hypothetical protein